MALYKIVFALAFLATFDAKQLHLCKNQGGLLRCGKDATLQIMMATYGRSDSHTCAKSDKKDYSRCVRIVTDQMRHLCSGKNMCILNENMVDLKDVPHCNVNDYLIVDYSCKLPTTKAPSTTKAPPTKPTMAGKGKKEFVCQGGNTILDCGPDDTIQIASAFWGRDSVKPCHDEDDWYHDVTDCKSKNALKYIKDKCEGEHHCDVKARVYSLGNPCWGVTKYLRVHYTCKAPVPTTRPPPKVQHVQICENMTSFIRCDNGGKMKITKAVFGRSDEEICPQKGSDTSNTTCKKDASLFFKTVCNNRRNCLASATVAIFGDPCPGTSKYLEVSLECHL